MAKFLSLGFLLSLQIFCNPFPSEKKVNLNVLLLDDSKLRATQISNVSYWIKLDINDKEEFAGTTIIQFDLFKTNSPLRVDFHKGKILEISINGKKNESISYIEGFFIVSPNLMILGSNKIEIKYTHPYSYSGNGLHKFVDPEDKETYLYTQFESYNANQMFPCFDQPDLKAKYTLEVLAPSKWKVISSTLPLKSEPRTNNKIYHTFPQTVPFSTYVFSLHAGPYTEWKDTSYKIPLRLFSRKSNSKFVDSKFWFAITKQGFDFYENYFGIDYPFVKYDQLIVPEFNFGAMENVSAVTFTERLLSRGTVTRRAKEKIANVILHEMAHMWFGNLVTMKWWDGLWLNESFATYMAAKAQYEATEFSEAWDTFFTGMKTWAYNSDKSITTHPIQATIHDTEEAFTNFDGITYGKGASVLKQLEYFVGAKNFQDGVRYYLKKFLYSNADLKDFLGAIELKSNKDLKKWSNEWLEEQGTNTLTYTQKCSNNQLVSIELIQGKGATSEILRSHRTKIALYEIQETKTDIYHTIDAEYSGNSTLVPIDPNLKLRCPDYIFLNFGDYDYVQNLIPKNLLSEINLETFNKILLDYNNLLSSLMLWRDLFEEVKSGSLELVRYKNFAIEVLPNDPRDLILESNIGHLTSSQFISYHSFLYFKDEPERSKLITDLENFTWTHMKLSASNSDRKRIWFQNYLSVANSKIFLNRAIRLLEKKESIPGLILDQELRWSVLKKICSFNIDEKLTNKLMESEKKRDSSRFGFDSALACEAAHPNPVIKSKWMSILTTPTKEYTASTLRSVMYNIFPIHQKNLQVPFVEFYYQNIKDKKVGGDENYQEIYSEILTPEFCTEENKHILEKFISHSREIPVAIQKNLILHKESEDECVNVRRTNKDF